MRLDALHAEVKQHPDTALIRQHMHDACYEAWLTVSKWNRSLFGLQFGIDDLPSARLKLGTSMLS